MKAKNLNPEFKAWTYIFLMLIILLVFSCGTRTKTKSESQSEINAKETAKEEDNSRKIDSIITAKFEEAKKEFSQNSKENSVDEGTKKTTIKATETFPDDPNDYRKIGNNGMALNDKNGRIVNYEIVIEEKFRREKQKEIETKIIEEQKKKSDSIAYLKIVKDVARESIKEVIASEKTQNKDVVQKGFTLGFWGWFWIILILLIIIAIWIFRKWIGIQFPFLKFLK